MITISEIKNTIQSSSQELNSQVETAFKRIKSAIPQGSTDKPSTATSKPAGGNGNCSLRIVSLAALALGIVGWATTEDATWAKFTTAGGSLLLLYSIFSKRSDVVQKTSANSGYQLIAPTLSQLKQTVQSEINNCVVSVANIWDQMVSKNKGAIAAIIEGSSASSDAKFLAMNRASLPKHIGFSILPYISSIVSSRSSADLAEAMNTIEAALKRDIRETALSQIADYEEIWRLIGDEEKSN